MRGFLILLILMAPSVFGMEFTEDTTFNSGNIIFHFPQGTIMDDFNIITDGITINENHKLIFIVEGGELDVTFYEWNSHSNLIGLKGDTIQDLIFKITVDNKKKYFQMDDDFFVDKIPIGKDEINVSYVEYHTSDTSNLISRTIEKDSWWETKFIEFEYDVEKDLQGIIEGKTIGISYLWIVIFVFLLIGIWWVLRWR